MASLVANQNRQSKIFADTNLNINTKGWKAEYVPTDVAKPQQAPLPLKLAPLPPLQTTPLPPVQSMDAQCTYEEQVYSPIEAKPMPQRLGGPPLETELIHNKVQPARQEVHIPIQRLEISQQTAAPISESAAAPKELDLNANSAGKAGNAVDFTKEFMAELMGGPVPPPSTTHLPGGQEFAKNFVSQLLDGSLTPAVELLVTEPAGKSVWDSAPVQQHKPCKKPKDQAEWEAILNANLAGMAGNEEDFTKDFMNNLMGGPGGAKSGPMSSGTEGAILNANPGGMSGMRAATPPGLRSVPKAPTCWVCAQPVTVGAKILKIKGYPMHPECFFCTACNVPLSSSSVFIKNDQLFCKEHINFVSQYRPTSRPTSRPSSTAPEYTEL